MSVADVVKPVAKQRLVSDGVFQFVLSSIFSHGIYIRTKWFFLRCVIFKSPNTPLAFSFSPRDRVAVVLECLVGRNQKVVHVFHRTEVQIEFHCLVLQRPVHYLTVLIGHRCGIYRLVINGRIHLIGNKYNTIAAEIRLYDVACTHFYRETGLVIHGFPHGR